MQKKYYMIMYMIIILYVYSKSLESNQPIPSERYNP